MNYVKDTFNSTKNKINNILEENKDNFIIKNTSKGIEKTKNLASNLGESVKP